MQIKQKFLCHLSLIIRKKSLVIRKGEKGTRKQEVFRFMNDYCH